MKIRGNKNKICMKSVAVLLLASMAMFAMFPSRVHAKDPKKKEETRTVFSSPFENETQQDQYEPSAAGLGDLVAVLLAEQDKIDVVERQQLTTLTAEQTKSLKGITGQDYAIKAGKLLKADTVITGRLFLVDKKLMVHVQAIDIKSQRVIASGELNCRPEYLPDAALQLAQKLAKQMSLPLPKIDLKKIDKSPIASLHFAHALSDFYAGNMDEAIMQLMRTIDLDPDCFESHYWAGLAYARQNENAHAAIEWKKYLKRETDPEMIKKTKELLARAEELSKQTAPPKLTPTSKPAEPKEEK